MLKIKQFVNELMSSNCYIVYDESSKSCIVIDPGSEKSLREIDFIETKQLNLDYIILTLEHSDHTWGVNALISKYDNAKVVCSKYCAEELPKSGDMYFRLYYDNPNYHYEVERVDITTDSINNVLDWNNIKIKFIPTPGHSIGSICILVDDDLFSGDTLMQYKPYINKKSGSKGLYEKNVQFLLDTFSKETIVYPGQGNLFLLKDK